jgi:hypothetical protein
MTASIQQLSLLFHLQQSSSIDSSPQAATHFHAIPTHYFV